MIPKMIYLSQEGRAAPLSSPPLSTGDFPLRPLHPRKLNYTPFAEAVIIAQEFWSIVGGEGTMEELFSIYQEVGREKTKYMLDSLAFGF